jgi:hypothetical protein
MNRQKIKAQIIGLIEDVQLQDITSDKAANEIIDLFVKKFRSSDQNALYWMWLKCIEDETGQNKDITHEFCKGQFLDKCIFELRNIKIPVNKTTTTLDTKQFTDYLEKIKVFAASELGIFITFA